MTTGVLPGSWIGKATGASYGNRSSRQPSQRKQLPAPSGKLQRKALRQKSSQEILRHLRSLGNQSRSAKSTAARLDGNLTQAFRTLPGCRVRWNLAALETCLEGVHGSDDKEVDGERHQRE